MTPNKLPYVIVTWKDANTGNDDVVTLDNVVAYHKPTIVHTSGWLLRDDDEGITLVNEYYDEFYRGRTFIYRPMVMKVEHFSLTKPRKKKQNVTKPDPLLNGEPATESKG